MTSVKDEASEEPKAVFHNNVLDWILTQNENVLPVEVVQLRPQSAPDANGSTTDTPLSLMKEEPEDPYFESFIYSCPSSPITSLPSAASTAIDIVDINQILCPKHELASHKCPHCQDEFGSLNLLAQHAVTHCTVELTRIQSSSVRKWKDQERREQAKANQNLPIRTIYKCRNCDEVFVSSIRLGTHLKLNPRHRDRKCSTCSKVYRSGNQLRLHIKDKHGGGLGQPHICFQCGEKFKWAAALKSHMGRAHNRGDVFKCQVCSKTFYNRRYFRIHEDRHLNPQLQQCPQCGLFKSQSHMKDHIERLHEGKRLKCNLCGDILRKSIRKHFLLKHSEVAGTLSVEDAVTAVYIDLMRPSKGQPKRVPRPRPVSQKLDRSGHGTNEGQVQSFPDQSQANETAYASKSGPLMLRQCPICKKHYIQLERHMRLVHYKEINYKCNFCSRAYVNSKQLRKHVGWAHPKWKLKIVGESLKKKAACPECRKLLNLSHLNRHIQEFHRDKRAFSCEVCNSWFKRKASVQRHEATHNHKLRIQMSRDLEGGQSSADPSLDTSLPGSSDQRARTKFLGARKNSIIPMRECHICKKLYVHLEGHIQASHFNETTTGSEHPSQIEETKETLAHQRIVEPGTNNAVKKEELPVKQTGPARSRQTVSANTGRKGRTLKQFESEDKLPPIARTACPDCGKMIAWQNLSRHIRSVHEGIRRFACELCDKAFHLKTGLQLHQKSKVHKQLQLEKAGTK